MQLKIFLLALLLALAPAPSAQACMSTPEERRAHFDTLDGDKDGFLTLEEYYGNTDADIALPDKQKHVAGLDTDKDGKINFDEFSAMKQKQRC